MNNIPTPSQVASWYHAQILRIPHGEQNPTKRYLTDDQILELFDGYVVIEEKIDGKMTCRESSMSSEAMMVCQIIEDCTGKHTVHDHVMKYTDLPPSKRIRLDSVFYDEKRGFQAYARGEPVLQYATISLIKPSVDQILNILWTIGQSGSHFGAPEIEGLVIKNHDKQLFGKWISDQFEDKLRGG